MVVFFDIDGTLVDDQSQIIPQSAIDAVERLCKNGHIPVINTGRPFSNIDPRVRAMAFRGWVCGCGMEIKLDDQWLIKAAPDAGLCRYTVEQVRKHGMKAMYETSENCIVTDGSYSDYPSIRKELARMVQKGFSVLDLREHPDFMKLVTFDGPKAGHQAFVTAMEPYYTCIERGDNLLELVLKGYSKAWGMKTILSALGVSEKDTMAIGDSSNDLPMFEIARISVSMGNGTDEVKRAADYVTADVLGDGIAKALHHFGLIE